MRVIGNRPLLFAIGALGFSGADRLRDRRAELCRSRDDDRQTSRSIDEPSSVLWRRYKAALVLTEDAVAVSCHQVVTRVQHPVR